MAWRRLGCLFQPLGVRPWFETHAATPTVSVIDEATIRVFYSGRDARNRSSIGTMTFRPGEPPVVLEANTAPVLTPGARGLFDDAGVSVASVVAHPDGDRLYYLGWNVGGSLPWRNAIGLAIGDTATASFERFSIGPLMDRSPSAPFGLSYPWVLRVGPADWRMWYGAILSWDVERARGEHVIRVARSIDGLNWTPEPHPALRPRRGEYGLARPSVIHGPAGWEMWFSRWGESEYRLGYARSDDGFAWMRCDGASPLAPPASGWEGGVVAYPCVFAAGGRRWMLYNGARYGAAGFGLAVWEETGN